MWRVAGRNLQRSIKRLTELQSAAQSTGSSCGVRDRVLGTGWLSTLCQNQNQGTDEASRNALWNLALLSAIGAGVVYGTNATCEAQNRVEETTSKGDSSSESTPGEDSSFHLLNLEKRRRTFFKYEKRIRSLSTPEKVFEYFSSIEEDGVKYMTHEDLLMALVPVYPPEGSKLERAGALLGERVPSKDSTAFLGLFDTDGDSKISYSEFMLILTLLSIPIRETELVFDIVDVDDNGVIDYEEFNMIIGKLQDESPQAKKSIGGLRTGLKVGNSSKPVGLIATFFGEDGSGKLSLEDFKAFLQDLHDRLLILEFMHYDHNGNGRVFGKDFARSICCGADVRRIDTYLDKVTEMDPALGQYEFTLTQFQKFHRVVDRLFSLSAALNFFIHTRGAVGKEELKSIIAKVADVQLSPQELDIVFYLFGDDSGVLNVTAFVDTFGRRRRTHLPEGLKGSEGGKPSFFQCLHNCFVS